VELIGEAQDVVGLLSVSDLFLLPSLQESFGLSALGSWGAGIVLDIAGGPDSRSGWLAVFCLLAGSIALGPVALWWSRRAGGGD